jgi:predicted transcriptional regulator
MKTHIASLLEKFNSVSKYQSQDNDKQIQAIALLVAVDILKTILHDKDLGAGRIGLVKRIAATYEIDMPL